MKIKISTAINIAAFSILGWCTYMHFSDEAVNPDAIDYFYTKAPLPEKSENGAYALIGLTAPASVSDIHTHGLELVSDAIDRARDNVENGEDIIDAYELVRSPDETEFLGKSEMLMCWMSLPIEPLGNIECASESELQKSVDDNSLLLSRYKSLLNYPRFVSRPYLTGRYQNLIHLNRLYLANVHSIYKNGRVKEAFSLLQKEREFYIRMSGESLNLIQRAIIMVTLKTNLLLLSDLMQDSNSMVQLFNESAKFDHDLMSGEPFDIRKSFQKEVELYDPLFCLNENARIPFCYEAKRTFKKNKTINVLYETSKEHQAMMSSSPGELETTCNRLKEEGHEMISVSRILVNIFNKHGHLIYTNLMGMNYAICEIMVSAYEKQALARGIIAYSEIVERDITGNAIQAYLDDNLDRLGDPFTEKPLVWDSKSNSLFFPEGTPIHWKWRMRFPEP